jgi:Lambda phage tail tube protein, TTP
MADFGYGGTVKFGTTNTISELTTITPPNFSADTVDSSTHDMTTIFRTFIKGLVDAGEIALEGFYKQADYLLVYDLVATRTLQSVTIIMPTTPSRTVFYSNCHVTGLETDDPIDDLIPVTYTLKVSGKPVIEKIT